MALSEIKRKKETPFNNFVCIKTVTAVTFLGH